jgi:hypothetical protein
VSTARAPTIAYAEAPCCGPYLFLKTIQHHATSRLNAHSGYGAAADRPRHPAPVPPSAQIVSAAAPAPVAAHIRVKYRLLDLFLRFGIV